MIQGKENKSVILFTNKKYIYSFSGILIPNIVLCGFQSLALQSREL